MKNSITRFPLNLVSCATIITRTTVLFTLAIMGSCLSEKAWCDDPTDAPVSPLSAPDKPLLGWTLVTPIDQSVGSFGSNPDQHDDHPGLLLNADFNKIAADAPTYIEISYPVANVDPDSVSIFLNVRNVTYLRLRIEDSTEQWHQFKVSVDPTSGWRKWTFSFKDFFGGKIDASFDPEYSTWNGAADQKWHGPMKAFDILVEAPLGQDKRVSLGISEPTLNLKAP